MIQSNGTVHWQPCPDLVTVGKRSRHETFAQTFFLLFSKANIWHFNCKRVSSHDMWRQKLLRNILFFKVFIRRQDFRRVQMESIFRRQIKFFKFVFHTVENILVTSIFSFYRNVFKRLFHFIMKDSSA